MADGNGESWVFDSLVNFLHGNIWKIPVLGFVEEKSVVFDPDSYNNLSEEKEEEFRKIHEEYKALVDYMLSSFMEDLQVTPEQVEEACQIREKQCHISESHITKVALEQLQAAEDFPAFRRIMTRKNIDLQLQSLELLVAKYGVLSPSLRSGAEPGDNGEEDFLQVVIRYCGDNGVFTDNTKTELDQSTGINVSCTLHQALQNLKQLPKKFSDASESKQEPKEEEIGLRDQDLITSTLTLNSSGSVNVSEPAQEQQTLINVSQSPAQRERESHFHSTPVPSQLIQQDMNSDLPEGGGPPSQQFAELSMDNVTKLAELTSPKPPSNPIPVPPPPQPKRKKDQKKSVKFDETTVAEIATTAPEQHHMLTSLRKALDLEPEDENETTTMNMDMGGSEEDIEKRRAYLRAQRDKLVALKKKERERQLEVATGGANGGGQQLRPKSARAAQMALRSPPAPSKERSLAARRALAARLKQELLHN